MTRSNRSGGLRLALAVGAILVAAITAPSLAQSRGRPGNRPPPGQPAQPAQGQQPGQPAAGAPPVEKLDPSQFIQRVKPRRWLLKTEIHIGATEFFENVDGVPMPRHDEWEFDTATLVWPLVPETGSSILEVFGPPDKEIPAIGGTVEINDRRVADEVEIWRQDVGGRLLPCGTWRAQWQVQPSDTGAYTPREVELVVESRQVCYETVFDDAAASKLGWPKGPWPPEAESCLNARQMFVDFNPQGQGFDLTPIRSLVSVWMEGRSPDEAPPVVLAKYLAAKVVEHSQINGEGLAFDRTGLWEGFNTAGAVELAATGRGTEIDLPCLLFAVYREVGLPARIVIGYDNEGEGKQVYLVDKGGSPQIRVWVEFAIYDEDNKTFGWVPVDVTAIRKKQNRLPNNYLNRPLKYFGTHDELDGITPIAFHFHPPTTVRSYGSPAFWGWFVIPRPPARADQRVRFDMTRTPSGGSNQSHLPADKRG